MFNKYFEIIFFLNFINSFIYALISTELTTSTIIKTSIIPSSSITVVPTPVTPTLPPETRTFACDSNPCRNGATCTNLIPQETAYSCDCALGWYGETCENPTTSFEVTSQLKSFEIANFTIYENYTGGFIQILEDKTSDAFEEVCNDFKIELMKTFVAAGDLLTVERITCVRIFFASIHIDYIIEVPLSQNITTEKLVLAVETGATVRQNNSLDTINIVIKLNTSEAIDFDECNATIGYCHSSATCINFIGGYSCSCSKNYKMLFDGSCKQDTSEVGNILLIVLPVVLGGLFILLIVICILLAIRRQKRKYIIASGKSDSFPALTSSLYYQEGKRRSAAGTGEQNCEDYMEHQ